MAGDSPECRDFVIANGMLGPLLKYVEHVLTTSAKRLCFYLCLSVYLSGCLAVCLSGRLSVFCLSVSRVSEK